MVLDVRTIPYGVSNFYDIRNENQLYVDKTRFIRLLEDHRNVFLIRPRRFGKSAWITMMMSYYDLKLADRFDWYFGDLDIGKDPTPHHNRYVTIPFDFSVVNDDIDTLEANFKEYGDTVLRDVFQRYPHLFPHEAAQTILGRSHIVGKLNELFAFSKRESIPLYILIDEYDNFANTVFSHHGQEAYHRFTHGDGFYRNFFAALKGGTGSGEGGVKRLFITGVSPITMDDVTSGFNVGTNISLLPEFNELLGFTEAEVRSILQEYQGAGVFTQDVDTALGIMKDWYNGYRFSLESAAELFNTDMVLYYLKHSIGNKSGPIELIDSNIRIDYGKLRHLMWVNRQLNGNFNRLKTVIEEGVITSQLVSTFPLKQITETQNFVSLLYYFGLLSISDTRLGKAVLRIPNQTVSELIVGYLRSIYQDAELFRVDIDHFSNLIDEMALTADWQPVFQFLADAIKQQTSIRDFIDGEKMIQGFLLAYLNVTNVFLCRSEREFAKGFADLYLEPFVERFPELKYGFLIELKYLKRRKVLKASVLQHAVEEASTQLKAYLQDEHLKSKPSVHHIGLVIVFHGWEMVAYEEVKSE